MNIKGKHITILGAVRSGIGAAKLAKALGAIPFVSDMGEESALAKSLDILKSHDIEYEFGGHSKRVYDSEFIITSPGVPSKAKVLMGAEKKGIKVYSELEFASWFCKGKIIGITGTNGKTTTTSLVDFIINESGLKSHVAGNIGHAFSEIVLDIKEDEFVSLEISSFQLDHIEKFSPFISVLLNITPDHLDRYDNDFSKYAASKAKIFVNQSGTDFFISNFDDQGIKDFAVTDKVKNLPFSVKERVNFGAFVEGSSIFFAKGELAQEICGVEDLSLRGEHNLANSLAAINVAKILRISNSQIAEALRKFAGVEHRLEFVRELNGVQFINDSKATNVDSVWYALRSFNTPLFLILGGKDKGNDYNQILAPVNENVKKILAIGSSADKIVEFFNAHVPVQKCDSLEDAVNNAWSEAVVGDTILLSPACASFDMFNDYEHRGKTFKEIVDKL